MKEHRAGGYWGRFAHSYDRDGEYVVGGPILQAIETRLLKEHCLGNLVEFGCGTGYWTRAVAGNAQRIIATDVSDEMLGVAQHQLRGLPDISIEKANCATAPFPQAWFDTVLMANLLHVIDRPLQCLQESHRILRHGGVLITVDFTSYGMKVFHKVRMGLRYLKRWGLPPREGQDDLSPDELAVLVESVGFKIELLQLIEAGTNALYLRARKALE